MTMIFLLIPIFFGVVIQKFGFCVPPIPTDSLMNDVREIKETVFHLKEKTQIFEDKVLTNILNKINRIEKDTKDIKNTLEKMNIKNVFDSKNENITKRPVFKETNETSTNTKKPQEALVLSNPIDYVFCGFVKNFSEIFRFNTNLTNLVEGTRDYGVRVCEKGWLVVQRRDSFDYQENFNRSWDEYKRGFGDVRKEFWFGNNFLHRLSHQNNLTLRIELEDFYGEKAWAEYETFKVGNEYGNYQLKIEGFSGTAPDSFSHHNNVKFSTFDKQNDGAPKNYPCAAYYGSGWWFDFCFKTNLNGIYRKKSQTNLEYRGINWNEWSDYNYIKSTKMMVKPKGNLTQFIDLTYKIFGQL